MTRTGGSGLPSTRSGSSRSRYFPLRALLQLSSDGVALPSTQTAPAIRARLLMLLAQQSAADIADRAGKERLQKEALEEVQKLMRAETGNPSAEDLLFTSFVTQ